MRVDEVMTSPVISVTADTTVADAARLMLSHKISGLPVVDAHGRLIGMVSEGDFLHRGELGTEQKRSWWLELLVGTATIADDYVHARAHRVGDVMSTELITTDPASSLDDAVALMTRHRIKRLPVLRDGKLIGVLARSDFMRAVVDARTDKPPQERDDASIREAILAELERQPWDSSNIIRVFVRDGRVDLDGTVFADHVREAARVAAENVRGVKSVRNNLVWVEPVSGYVLVSPGSKDPRPVPTDAGR